MLLIVGYGMVTAPGVVAFEPPGGVPAKLADAIDGLAPKRIKNTSKNEQTFLAVPPKIAIVVKRFPKLLLMDVFVELRYILDSSFLVDV
jgi:hypothetical protein